MGKGWGIYFRSLSRKKIFTTELLESPLLEGNHLLIKEFSYIYLGILNYDDIIISKLFRSYPIDVADCLALYESEKHEINSERLKSSFLETSSYDIGDEKNRRNLEHFLREIGEEGDGKR